MTTFIVKRDVGGSSVTHAAWQLTAQRGGDPAVEDQRYRLHGAGPEASLSLTEALSVRLRAQWEFGARDVLRGNNLWVIFNQRF